MQFIELAVSVCVCRLVFATTPLIIIIIIRRELKGEAESNATQTTNTRQK